MVVLITFLPLRATLSTVLCLKAATTDDELLHVQFELVIVIKRSGTHTRDNSWTGQSTIDYQTWFHEEENNDDDDTTIRRSPRIID